MHGFKPQGVERAPLYLTINGEQVALEGGYYPARYDGELSDKVGAWSEKEDLLNRSESLFAVPSAKKGHTRARADEAPGLPLRLDTGLIMEHLHEAVTFIELGEAVRMADKITQSPQWRQEFIRVYGRESYNAIRPNLRGIVRQEAAPKEFVADMARKLRPFLVYYGLGFNLKVALFQLSNLVPAMGDIGASHVMRGLGALSTRGMAVVREIWEVSPYMKSRTRSGNIDQDLQKARRQIDPALRNKSMDVGGVSISMETFAEIGMMPMLAMDTVCATAVWMGAYSKEISKLQGERYGQKGVDPQNAHHEQAVVIADNAVKRINPDFDASSRCQFLRGKGMSSLFNMFSSNAVLFAQRRRYHHQAWQKGVLSTKGYARYQMYDFILQGVAIGVVFALAQGGDDDPEKRAKQFGRTVTASILDTYSMAVPILGPAVSRILMGDTKSGSVRTSLDAPFAIGERAALAARKSVETGEIHKELLRGAAALVSFLAKVPLDKQVDKAMRGYEQMERGEGGPGLMLMPRYK